MMNRPVRLGHALRLLVLCLCAAPASATWSIVLVDRSTGEVCVATATCIPDEELRRFVPVLWVGAGAGAEQHIIDPSGRNKLIMWNGFQAGLTPQQILDDLLFGNGTQPGRRQYGIAGLNGPAVTWSGGQVTPGKGQLTGEIGDVSFAVQGNSLTGPEVISAAWEAIMLSTGDSGQRVLAGMSAAAAMGGDGRCSCSNSAPTSCGAPPPSFSKSAHTLVMIVARFGDTDGICNPVAGCANGDYYLDLEVIGGPGDPDPVGVLEVDYAAWRAERSGRPDHILSRVSTSTQTLVAGSEERIDVEVELVDLDGVPLGHGGALVTVGPSDPLAKSLVEVGPVTDHGDGTYTFAMRARKRFGMQDYVIVADDGFARATLYPYLHVVVEPPSGLHAGAGEVSLLDPEPVPFSLVEPMAPFAPYAVLGSASGSHPGLALDGLVLPLNPDAWFRHTLEGGADVAHARGFLDERGRALITWHPDPKLAGVLAGRSLTWAALVGGDGLRVTNTVVLALAP